MKTTETFLRILRLQWYLVEKFRTQFSKVRKFFFVISQPKAKRLLKLFVSFFFRLTYVDFLLFHTHYLNRLCCLIYLLLVVIAVYIYMCVWGGEWVVFAPVTQCYCDEPLDGDIFQVFRCFNFLLWKSFRFFWRIVNFIEKK